MTAVELKVKTSTAAAAISGLALYALGRYVFKTGVPDVVASWVYVLVPGALTFAAGYAAKHTPRQALPPGAGPAGQPGIPAPGIPSAMPPARPEKTLIPPAAPE